MKKRKITSTNTIIVVGLIGLVIIGVASTVVFHPANHTEFSKWMKNNFFPADETAQSSLLDMKNPGEQEYQGSTVATWILCIIASSVVLLISFLYLARERGYFA